MTRISLRLAFLLPGLSLLLLAGSPTPGLEARRRAFQRLLSEQWDSSMRTNPDYASTLGDLRFNDKLPDCSPAAAVRKFRVNARFLKRFEAVDTSGFPETEILSRDLMVWQLRLSLEGERFAEWEMPISHYAGIHVDLPQEVSQFPFGTVKDYEDYLSRLHQVPRAFRDTRAVMGLGLRDGRMPPAFQMPLIIRQCEEFAAMKPEESPYAGPLQNFPSGFSDGDRARLREGILRAIAREVQPAYGRLAAFLRKDYAGRGRREAGVWSLPDGKAYYAYQVKVRTSTRLTPGQVHQMGLEEVARIEGQMLGLARELGAKDLKAFTTAIRQDPRLHPASRQDLVDRYNHFLGQMDAKLPLLFGHLPKAKVVALPLEEFAEKEGSAALYRPGPRDASRPGQVRVNTWEFANRQTLNIETTAYHEGVPGHHLQIAIAQESPDLPAFRRSLLEDSWGAFIEGWALYAERLGEEVGLYQDPYSRFGHLQDEMLRAIRLVVDSGLHDRKWTRQQVVDYFHEHSTLDEVDIQSEADRYIVWPGQALSYKVGQLKILELRGAAQRALGSKFDVRAFHDLILGGGPVPLDVLETQVRAWIGKQAAMGQRASG